MRSTFPRFLLVIVLCLAVFSASAPIDSAEGAKSRNVLRIQLPKNIQPEEVTILVWVYTPNHARINCVYTKSGTHAYSYELPDQVSSIDIDVYHPRCKTVSASFYAEDAVRKPFIPKFKPIPLVPLKLRLIDAKGKPISGQKILLRQAAARRQHGSGNMLFYDGSIHMMTIGTATMDSSGEARVSIAKRCPRTSFQLSRDKASENKPGWPPVSVTVDLQKKHTKPILVRVDNNGKSPLRKI